MPINVKACFAKSSDIKSDFKNSICALPISVGQPYHEAGKLVAAVELINKYFSKCVIIICDFLQRHNSILYCNEDEATAYKEAVNAGTQWIERNTDIINRLKISYELIRWDSWYKSNEVAYYLKKINELCSNDGDFYMLVDECANHFVNEHLVRYDSGVFSKPIEKVKNICENYLKEEAAVLLMWRDYENYDFLAYPGSYNKVMANIYERFVKNNEKCINKLTPLKIKFKKIGCVKCTD